MSFKHIARPSANALVSLSPIPVARANYLCLNDYPRHLFAESYVFAENATAADAYDISQIVSTLNIQIESVTVKAVCQAENALNACTAEMALRIAATSYFSGVVEALTINWTEFSATWLSNPDTNDFWTIADINALEAGLQLISGGAGTEARCTQLYLEISFSILGEKISPINALVSDKIFKDQGFSIIIQLPTSTALHETGNTNAILYEAPDGSTGSLNAIVIDTNRLFASIPKATISEAGKWIFKGLITLASGEVIETENTFVNVSER